MHRASAGGILPGGRVALQAGRKGEESMSAEENKAIQDMSHEEVAAALPKLRQEAAKADARVHQAMERLAQTAEVPTYVEVHEDHLLVDVRGNGKSDDAPEPPTHPPRACAGRRSRSAHRAHIVEGMANTGRPPTWGPLLRRAWPP